MANSFGEIAFTPRVQEEQKRHGSFAQYSRIMAQQTEPQRLGSVEQEFIASLDGFYMATVSESGWPYVQYRGGAPGFLHVLDESTLAFADLRGNRQYISVGNLRHDARAALFLMDYARQIRLKILARVEVVEGEASKALLARLPAPEKRAVVERLLLLHLEAFDWNCQQHITPKFTTEQVKTLLDPLQEKLQALEAENAALRARLD
jgi:uncharacterized protein